MTIMTTNDLDENCFAQCPIWGWSDNMEGYVCYVSITTVESRVPNDVGTLFVMAEFRPFGSIMLHGYIIDAPNPYGIGLFVKNNHFIFNKNLGDRAKDAATLLFKALGVEPFPLFPLRYTTAFFSEDGTVIEGVFDMQLCL